MQKQKPPGGEHLTKPAGTPAEAGEADFSPAWYLGRYPDVAASGMDPLEHYRLFGKGEGRYPSGQAEREAENISFEAAWYLEHYPDVAASGMEPLGHYLLRGRREGRHGSAAELTAETLGFHARRYVKAYGDVELSGIDPLEHYRVFGTSNGRHPSAEARQQAENIAFEAAWYLERYPDVAESGMDPLEHFLLHGREEGRDGAPSAPHDKGDFDAAFYLKLYPDIAEAGVDPGEHYFKHGRAEGRAGSVKELRYERVTGEIDAAKETIMLVSHEASQTGAPILAYNILEILKRTYNVVVILIGPGVLSGAFQRAASATLGPFEPKFRYSDVLDEPVLDFCSAFKPTFAIVNSLESRRILFPLDEAGIPTVSLIHEFAAYTLPRTAIREAITFSTRVIFPAKLVWSDAASYLPAFRDRPAYVFPQGQSRVPPLEKKRNREKEQVEREMIAETLRPAGGEAVKLVIGLGGVEFRKGVDQFIATAAAVSRAQSITPFRFVWVGPGFRPDEDAGYSTYLNEHVKRAGLADKFAFLNEVQAIEEIYRQADILLLSSRLDPFPNVAIDSLLAGLPVVCQADASGVAELLATDPELAGLVASYGDAAGAAQIIVRLGEDEAYFQRVSTRAKSFAAEMFDMESYIEQVLATMLDAGSVKRQQEADTEFLLRHDAIDRDFYSAPSESPNRVVDATRLFVREWSTIGLDRHPRPGFHALIYAEHYPELARHPYPNPLAHFIRAGQPNGPWRLDLIGPEPTSAPLTLRTALHLHINDPEDGEKFARAITKNVARPDLFVSSSSELILQAACETIADWGLTIARRVVCSARRHSAGPFFSEFSPELRGYDVAGHLHGRPKREGGPKPVKEDAVDFFAESLLGGREAMLDAVLGSFARDRALGLVFPNDPAIAAWGENLAPARDLLGSLKLSLDLPRHYFWPSRAMFLVRPSCLEALWSGDGTRRDHIFLAQDGKPLEALQLLLPFIIKHHGFNVAGTHVAGVTRRRFKAFPVT